MKKEDIKKELLKFKTAQEVTKVENIEELGIELYIKTLSVQERTRLLDEIHRMYDYNEEGVISNPNEGNFLYMVYVVFMSIVDIDGEKIFESMQEALEIVPNFPDGCLGIIHDQVLNINGINLSGDEENDPVKKQEETCN